MIALGSNRMRSLAELILQGLKHALLGFKHAAFMTMVMLFLMGNMGRLAWAQPSSEVIQAKPVADLNSLMNQIEQAAAGLDYSGHYHISNGQQVMNYQVISIQDGLGIKQRIWTDEPLAVELVRHNQAWVEILPTEQRAYSIKPIPARFPALRVRVSDLNKYYRAFQLSADKYLADRLCTPYSVISRELDRPSWYLCVDVENQLLLERHLIDESHQVLNSMYFSDLQLGQAVNVAQANSSSAYESWLQETPERVSVQPLKTGWRFRFPDGFEVVSSSQLQTGTDPQIIQMVLSDGLSVFSIFIQKLNEQEKLFTLDQQMFMQETLMYAHRVDDYVVMATGVMPMQTLKEVAMSATFIPPVVTQ